MKKKTALKLIRKECKKLPPRTYWALQKFYKPQFIDGHWRTGQIVECPVNHFRRAKKAYNKWGVEALRAYFTVFSQAPKLENEESTI